MQIVNIGGKSGGARGEEAESMRTLSAQFFYEWFPKTALRNSLFIFFLRHIPCELPSK